MHLGKNVSPSAACLLLPTHFLIFHLKTGTQTGNPAAPTVPHECGTRRKFMQSFKQKERRHRRGKRSLMRSLLAGIDLHCLPAPNLSVSLVFHRACCLWNCLNTEKYLLSSQRLKFRGRLFPPSPWWRLKPPCSNLFEFLARSEGYFTQISHPFDAPFIWNSHPRGPP